MPLTPTAAFLTLATLHFDRLVAFYQDLLAQAPTTLMPNVYAEFQLPGMRLGIFRPKAIAPAPEGEDLPNPHLLCSGMSLCLEVANLESAIAHLTALGYPPPGTILTASHGREIYAFDPDGNWLILHQGVVGNG